MRPDAVVGQLVWYLPQRTPGEPPPAEPLAAVVVHVDPSTRRPTLCVFNRSGAGTWAATHVPHAGEQPDRLAGPAWTHVPNFRGEE